MPTINKVRWGIASSILSLCLLNDAFAMSGSGAPYVGLGIGKANANLDGELTSTTTNLVTGNLVSFSDRQYSDGMEGWDGQLSLGYKYDFVNNLFLAGELFGSLNSMKGQIFEFQQRQITPGNQNTVLQNTSVKSTYTLGAALIAGYQFKPATSYYGRIGYVNSHFEAQSFTHIQPLPALILGTNLPEFSKNASGLHLGIGTETKVSDHVGIRQEYTWNQYERFSGSSLVGPNAGNNVRVRVLDLKPSVEQFNLAAVYYFDKSAQAQHMVTPQFTGNEFYLGIAGARDTSLYSIAYRDELFNPLNVTNAPYVVKTESSDTNARGWSGELYAGLGHAFTNRWYLGAEIFGALNSTSTEKNLLEIVGGVNIVNDTIKLHAQNTLGAVLKIGYQATDDTMYYVRSGYINSHVNLQQEETVSFVDVLNRDYGKNMGGIQYGFGAETRLNDKFSIRTEFDVNQYGETTLTSPLSTPNADGDTVLRTYDVKLINQQFKIGITRHFFS